MRRDRLGQAFLLRCDCTFTLYVTMSLCLWWIISSLAVLFDMSRLMYWAQYNFCNAAASIRWSSIKCGALDGGGTLISLLLTDDSIFLCILGLTCILSSRTRTLNKMTTSHKHKMILCLYMKDNIRTYDFHFKLVEWRQINHQKAFECITSCHVYQFIHFAR